MFMNAKFLPEDSVPDKADATRASESEQGDGLSDIDRAIIDGLVKQGTVASADKLQTHDACERLIAQTVRTRPAIAALLATVLKLHPEMDSRKIALAITVGRMHPTAD
jgi:hypothetical protein